MSAWDRFHAKSPEHLPPTSSENPTSVYEERGAQDGDRCDQQAAEGRLVSRLQHLGYRVTLEPVGAT
jgi:hypothetical protein